ncbi:restriction endonuclease subunit S [Methanobacterium alkalithermotolerans]|uniref:Restriction endonuclease subunit S n=1 Tax=Methanobacterium alkalithermotolerans TaxID=2731220 RepID=A0A8T8K613_9EURY|nr:restriction endonuclease subunit S [Methanobacterium alkalithermotolerans]QUH23457.1 restriction endonuclease subunit S [Methanobacterium alkalithermotolerans]
MNSKYKETEIGLVPEAWELVSLGDLIAIKHGFAFKGKFFSEEETQHILLTPGNFKIGGGFNDSKFKYYTGEIPENYILKKDDIIVTMTDLSKEGDTLGYPAKIPFSHDKKYLHNQRLGLLKFKSKEVTPEFLYWKLRNHDYRHLVLATASGTTVKHTSPSRILKIEIALPPLYEQEKIAKILSDIEQKIEINQKMNRTLEGIGQAIFKHWFVHYEFPNEERKPYKSSGGEMVDSELGEIPKGWEVKSLDKIANYLNGLALQKFPPEKDDYLPVIKIRELKQGITAASDKASSKIDSNYIIDDGDVIFSWSGSLEVVLWCGGKGALNQHLFKVSSEKYPKWFYYYWTKYHLETFRQTAADKTTTMGHIKRKDLSDALVVAPSNELFSKFNKIMTPIIDLIINNNVESRNLSKIRDSLLPKIMSGKIRVINIKKKKSMKKSHSVK